MGQVTSLLCLHPPSLLAVPLLSLQSRQHKQQLKCEKQDPERGDHLNPVLELLCVPGFGEFLGTQEEESSQPRTTPVSTLSSECHQDLNPGYPASIITLTLRIPLEWGGLVSLHPSPQVY
ncbi:uncharacterized protein LOC128932267 isoform X2 [Callithrix jacchus]